MVIVICLKQVLNKSFEGTNSDFDAVDREKYELINNPNDLYAIEEGLRLRDKYGGTVICISMGPEKCQKNLREILSLGVDRAILLSGKDFAGSDTLATSYTLAAGIRKIKDFDLILMGEQSLDGETGQVGPSLAEHLDISHVTNVNEIHEINEAGDITVKKELEDRDISMKFKLPALLGVRRRINEVRIPTIFGRLKANGMSIPVWLPSELDIDVERIGLRGSPTKVLDLYEPQSDTTQKEAEIFTFEDNKECIPYILSKTVKA